VRLLWQYFLQGGHSAHPINYVKAPKDYTTVISQQTWRKWCWLISVVTIRYTSFNNSTECVIIDLKVRTKTRSSRSSTAATHELSWS